MTNYHRISSRQRKHRNIADVLFLYWIAVIAWQTFRPVANRSLVDSGVKIGAFLLVIIYSYNTRSKKGFSFSFVSLFLLFCASQASILAFDSSSIGTSSLITVLFMIAQIFVFFGWSREALILQENILQFCRRLLWIALFMSFYNMIFDWSRFKVVFSLDSGNYGYECNSFLYSNHEFALYLAATVIALTWLLIRKEIKPFRACVCYTILAVNLLSTYSRTALLGCIVAVMILLFFYNQKAFWCIAVVGGILLLIIYANSYLYSLVFEKILKGSFTEGQVMDEERNSIYNYEWNAYSEGNFLNKFLGFGYAGASQFEGHNAYLMLLLTGGILLLTWFIFIVLFAIRCSFICLKKDKSVGSLMLGFQAFSLLFMVAQTPILFYSSMDSFFITSISILIPMYVANGYRNSLSSEKGTNDENSAVELCLPSRKYRKYYR